MFEKLADAIPVRGDLRHLLPVFLVLFLAAGAVPAAADISLNEIRIDQPSTDNDEYFELAGTPGESLNQLTYVVIGDGSAGSGVVEEAIDLSGLAISASGFFVAAEGTFSLGTPDLFTNLNFENSDNVTHLVVRDWSASEGDDLDSDDDGTLDLVPWSAVVDCVALIESPGSGDRTYCATSVGPDGSFVPAHAFKCPGGWEIGAFSTTDGTDTPGAANACPSPALVINEIDYDQPGTDTAEFIEIKNTGTSAIDLAAYALELINGNGTSLYRTIDLPAVSLGSGDYFVVCGDAAQVADCDLDVSPDSNLVQNGSPDAVAITLGGVIVDTVSYEGSTGGPYTEGTGAGSDSSSEPFLSLSRLPDGADSDDNAADFALACITPGAANSPIATGCSPMGPALEIFEIQGDGLVSPWEGFTLSTLDNVVTAVGVDGFFIQTPPERADGDVDTSDGIFVFTVGAPVGVSVGDRVDVEGQVQEFFEFTEISNASFTIVGTGFALPPVVTFDEMVPSRDPAFPSCAIEFECYEGMLIDIPVGGVGGSNQRFNPDPVAEIHVAAGDDRPFREPGIEFPGIVGLPLWDGNPEVFELDPDKLGLPNQVVPAGSTFSARGVLGYEFGGYELWPTDFSFTPAVLPEAVRAREEGEFTVGSLNLFRLFDDVADGDEQVVSSAEYATRLAKFSSYVREVLGSPEILGVQEVEKLGVLEDLAAVIFADDPSVVYSAYLVEGNDVGGIDVGFLVRQSVAVDAVTQLGAAEILTFDGSLLHDRPPLLLEGRYLCPTAGEFPLAVMVNHNRSLGGIDDSADGPRVRQKRLEQAQSIAQKVQDFQTANPAVPLVLVGDYNAFEFSDGYVDVIGQIVGDVDPAESLLSGPDLVEPNLSNAVLSLPESDRYSFVFRGSAQVLDHALVSAAAQPWVRGFEYGRGNADAAFDLLGDAATVLRSSDHDGYVLYLESDCDGDGIPFSEDVCLGTSIPEDVPTVRLGTNRHALVDGDGVFDTNSPPGGGPGDVFTIDDTAGCSCEQIIEGLGLGKGHEKFGCSVGAMRNWVGLVQP